MKYTDPTGDFLTWNIGNGGGSIGFNLTPIGIPLGAGINVGWGNGFSVGGYGEVGYRVGGTGVGAGATVSQSLDYNFGYSSWSTTTSGGAYYSFGPVTMGANVSQSYNMSNGQWSTSWGVSTGLGIGNGRSGVGFNIGYGSGGFSYGVGGYYKARTKSRNGLYHGPPSDVHPIDNQEFEDYMATSYSDEFKKYGIKRIKYATFDNDNTQGFTDPEDYTVATKSTIYLKVGYDKAVLIHEFSHAEDYSNGVFAANTRVHYQYALAQSEFKAYGASARYHMMTHNQGGMLYDWGAQHAYFRFILQNWR